MVDGSGLENRQGESPRGFESHPLRHSHPLALGVSSPTRDISLPKQVLVAPPREGLTVHFTQHRAGKANHRRFFCRCHYVSERSYDAYELHPVGSGWELRGGRLPEAIWYKEREPDVLIRLVRSLSLRRGSTLSIFDAAGAVVKTQQRQAVYNSNAMTAIATPDVAGGKSPSSDRSTSRASA